MVRLRAFVAAAALALGCSTAWAALITPGFTFSVADAFVGPSGVGTHFHSNTGGAFGNPAGLAEVGRLGDEEVRGLSEYNIAGQLNAASAFVTFDVNQLGGLFGQANYQGPISIFAYVGNNTEDLSDFEIATSGFVATFNTTGLAAGDILSFDITALFNAAIANGDASMGIRLQLDPLIAANLAIVFNDFRLTTDNQSTGVPEPGSLALMAIALAGMGVARRRKAR